MDNISILTDDQKNRLEELNNDLSAFPDIHSEDIKLAKAYIDLKRIVSGAKND